MAKRRTPPSLAEAQSRIRAAGLRSTVPRVAVLEQLRRAPTPLSHAEIYSHLAALGFDRATLYRNLIDLADAGLVTRTDLGDHVWRFELRANGGKQANEHPHFVCTDCGGVSCLPGVSVRITRASGAPRALRREAVEVQLKGICDRCD